MFQTIFFKFLWGFENLNFIQTSTNNTPHTNVVLLHNVLVRPCHTNCLITDFPHAKNLVEENNYFVFRLPNYIFFQCLKISILFKQCDHKTNQLGKVWYYRPRAVIGPLPISINANCQLALMPRLKITFFLCVANC
jgi:hypothetical protein